MAHKKQASGALVKMSKDKVGIARLVVEQNSM